MKALFLFILGFILAVTNPGLGEFASWVNGNISEAAVSQVEVSKVSLSNDVKRHNYYIFSVFEVDGLYYLGIYGRFIKCPMILEQYSLSAFIAKLAFMRGFFS